MLYGVVQRMTSITHTHPFTPAHTGVIVVSEQGNADRKKSEHVKQKVQHLKDHGLIESFSNTQ